MNKSGDGGFLFLNYHLSSVPKKLYYQALCIAAIMNYKDTAFQLLRDNVNQETIDDVFEEWNGFILGFGSSMKKTNETIQMIERMLLEINSPLLIAVNVNKDPYIKQLTSDSIINLTGSGIHSYIKKQLNDNYEIINLDTIFSGLDCSRVERNLQTYFKNKYSTLPVLEKDFDLIYQDVLTYCRDCQKKLVIVSNQFYCCQNIDVIKGKVIVLRDSIDTCYQKMILDWIEHHDNYSDLELSEYKEKAKIIYSWYTKVNEFIKKIDKVE